MNGPMVLLPIRLIRFAAVVLTLAALAAPPLVIRHRTHRRPPEAPPPPAWAISKLRPAMIEIPAGRFKVGSSKDEKDRFEGWEPQHEVRITRDFLLAETEVTQAQYEAVIGTNPSGHKNCPDCPVENVSWTDAIDYCNKLSDKEGLTRCYEGETWKRDCTGYRLPTEAEWGYAARAGREGEMYVGTNEVKEACRYDNYGDATLEAKDPEAGGFPCDDGFEGTSAVASFHANDFHLFDMGGNVLEWVWDRYQTKYEEDAVEDPSGPESGSFHLFRGGSWNNSPQSARVANRSWSQPSLRLGYLGFRLSRSLPSSLLPSNPLPAATDIPDLAPRSPGGPGVR